MSSSSTDPVISGNNECRTNIDDLPNELLFEILKLCLVGSCSSSSDSYFRPGVIADVCDRWLSIAYNTPHLWTTLWVYWGVHLEIDHDIPSKEHEPDISEHHPTEDTGLLPWEHVAHFLCPVADTISYVYREKTSKLPTREEHIFFGYEIMEWLDCAMGQPLSLHFVLGPDTPHTVSSTQTIEHITLSKPQTADNALEFGTNVYPTLLEELELILPWSESHSRFHYTYVDGVTGEPKEGPASLRVDLSACKELKSLTLINYSRFDIWITGTKFITIPFSQLTSLHIAEGLMSQSWALTILRGSKNLRQVSLRRIESQPLVGSVESICLGSLETLYLSFGPARHGFPREETGSYGFIDKLETPVLQSLSLEWIFDGPVLRSIYQMLYGAEDDLHTLRLYGIRSDVKALQELLATFPMLNTVEIAPPCYAHRISYNYGRIPEDSSAGNLPHLKNLKIWSMYDMRGKPQTRGLPFQDRTTDDL
ncbi:hypothetical protein H0H92_009191 [Tricholoma furcatifolium]|nr:hypothetical protein H0H92_009191 [Tricholoma furcatifolium]